MNADEAKALANSVYQKALDPFFITYLGCWKREDPPDAQSTAIVSGALVTALITVAARIAIDLDLSEDQLSSILSDPMWPRRPERPAGAKRSRPHATYPSIPLLSIDAAACCARPGAVARALGRPSEEK